MSDQPDNLMRTYLRRIDMKLDALAERVGNLETEMVRMRRHLALIGDETAHERAARASIENRLDRVERRSQIADGVR